MTDHTPSQPPQPPFSGRFSVRYFNAQGELVVQETSVEIPVQDKGTLGMLEPPSAPTATPEGGKESA